MKLNDIRLLATLGCLLATVACTQTDWDAVKTLKPGYLTFSDSSKVNLVITKDDVTGAVVYDPVDIRLQFFFHSQVEDFQSAGVRRILQNEAGERVESVEQLATANLSDTIKVDIFDRDALFSGMTFNPDSIRSDYSFLFETFMVLSTGDTIVSSGGQYQATPVYLNFCTLPDIPEGTWEVHNKATGYKKDVEIKYMEVSPGVWFFVITDFGIDWSTWNDFWYGTNFSLACPPAGDYRFAVKLAAWGIDLPSVRIEMENDFGVLETRPLRIMPWTYADDSPDIGYFDADNQQFIFKNVKVRDTWWGIDNMSIEEVTYTFKGEEPKVTSPPTALGLDPFYQKYINADGIPVISSGKVPDQALIRVMNMANQMLEKSPAVRQKMISHHSRIGIMSKDEVTTDIPEHAFLANDPNTDWDKRARGLGGTVAVPITTCAEENVLCYEKDPYKAEDIFVHEFAHAIHLMGIRYVDPQFDQKLMQAYEAARSAGKWDRTYAGTNYEEYWANGLQCWYNCAAHSDPPNGVHNQVNTRSKLKTYDPGLYDLINLWFADDVSHISCHRN